MRVIYEDKDILAVYKEAGEATQSSRIGQMDVVSMATNYLYHNDKKLIELHLINRLDQPVRGIVLLTKNSKAAANLSRQLSEGQIDKYYRARVMGLIDESEGRLENFLARNKTNNTSRLCNPGEKDAKPAVLEFCKIKEDETSTYLYIHLLTGRHHQIRVQLSGWGHPILGDRKYGSLSSIELSEQLGIKDIELEACKLVFSQPSTKEKIIIEV